jgi:hypothetical protein
MTAIKQAATPEELRLQWLRSRLSGIGSSDATVLALGKVFKRDAMSVYIDKTRTPEQVVDDGADNPHYRRGYTYEPICLALYEQQYGEVHVPQTDEERYGLFHCKFPGKPHRYCDWDGVGADEWIVEAKSPLESVAEDIRQNGPRPYTVVQSHCLAAIAHAAGTPWFGPGRCKGTRLVIYSPETIQIQVFEIPLDLNIAEEIWQKVDRFWFKHVVPRNPPFEFLEGPFMQPPPSTKKPTWPVVESEALKAAAAAYRLAKERSKAAEFALDNAKETIARLLGEAKLERASVDGEHFSYLQQAGHKGFNMALLRAEHPELNFARYETQGEPFFVLRGPTKRKEEEDGGTVESEVASIVGELRTLAGRSIDLPLAEATFNALQRRAELYANYLSTERDALEMAIVSAAASLAARKE